MPSGSVCIHRPVMNKQAGVQRRSSLHRHTMAELGLRFSARSRTSSKGIPLRSVFRLGSASPVSRWPISPRSWARSWVCSGSPFCLRRAGPLLAGHWGRARRHAGRAARGAPRRSKPEDGRPGEGHDRNPGRQRRLSRGRLNGRRRGYRGRLAVRLALWGCRRLGGRPGGDRRFPGCQ